MTPLTTFILLGLFAPEVFTLAALLVFDLLVYIQSPAHHQRFFHLCFLPESGMPAPSSTELPHFSPSSLWGNQQLHWGLVLTYITSTTTTLLDPSKWIWNTNASNSESRLKFTWEGPAKLLFHSLDDKTRKQKLLWYQLIS